MTTSTKQTPGAERHGASWGVRAEDWAENELQQIPTYEEAIRRVALTPGQSVLDIGCGAGVFLRAAADHGARVAGIDAAARLIDLALSRVPEADLRTGDMQSLPFADGAFDVVTGFNSFFFADDMVVALREAGRVAKPGAAVVIQVWGRPERCDLNAMKGALHSFVPPAPPDAPQPPALCEPGVLEGIAQAAGLHPLEAFDLSYGIEYENDAVLARQLLAPGLVVEVLEHAPEQEVRDAFVAALEQFRGADGVFRLTNEWHYLIARA